MMRKTLHGLFHRKPDFIVGAKDDPYLLRWHIIPRNRFFNIYLHQFLRDDDDRALHDHPWGSVSIILKGEYMEHLADGSQRWADCGTIRFRRAKTAHRISLRWDFTKEVMREGGAQFARKPAWTLFITGRRVREWGFHCPQGWRHWRDFTNAADGGATIGRGCDD